MIHLPGRIHDTAAADAGRTILVAHGGAWVYPGWFFWIIVKALGVLVIEVSRRFSFIAASATSPAAISSGSSSALGGGMSTFGTQLLLCFTAVAAELPPWASALLPYSPSLLLMSPGYC